MSCGLLHLPAMNSSPHLAHVAQKHAELAECLLASLETHPDSLTDGEDHRKGDDVPRHVHRSVWRPVPVSEGVADSQAAPQQRLQCDDTLHCNENAGPNVANFAHELAKNGLTR